MALNKSRGNMYPFVSHTWNPIRGKCPHGCVYCFMKGRDVGPLRLEEKALEDNLGSGRTIFVGSSTDMWAATVPSDWIHRVLDVIDAHTEWAQNTFIFQSKNPSRFFNFAAKIRPRTILGTTLETNRDKDQKHCGFAPAPWARAAAFLHLKKFRKMISIEPIMAFDFKEFLDWIRQIGPEFVSIGADSKGHNLPEPAPDDLTDFIEALRSITEVKIKKNLSRLMEL